MQQVNKKDALISVVLPVFNGEEFLSKSIDSVLMQTYKNIELIIVNDNSTDNTLTIANQYAEKNTKIKVINNAINKKLPASLNIGHKECKGDFITWTSDDNFYEEDALQVLLDNLISNNADLVYSNFTLVDNKGQKIREVSLSGIENIFFGNFIGCCFLYKKEVYQRNNGYNESYFLIEDYDFWLRSLIHSKFYHVNKCLYNYRKHDKSLTNQIAINQEKHLLWKNNLKAMFLSFWKNLLKSNYLEITEFSTKTLLYEKIEFNWLKNNRDTLKWVKAEIKKNQNFSNVSLVEKVFLIKTIEAMINEKQLKNNISRSLFIVKEYAGVLDKNTIKTLIKYSFLNK